MLIEAPIIDPRTASDVEREVTELLRSDQRLGWQPAEEATGDPGTALIRIFSRFAGLVIDRLNQAPEKNFLAFLNMLGEQIAPPQPARVPLTFTLAEGALRTAEVRAGAQVAAPPAEGESQEVIYETEEKLVLTPTRLVAVCVRDPANDKSDDYTALASAGNGFPAFKGTKTCPHHLYLALDDDLLLARPTKVTLKIVTPEPERFATLSLDWTFWNGAGWRQFEPKPETAVDGQTYRLVFNNPPLPQLQTITGHTARWIRAELGSDKIASGELLSIQAIDTDFSFDMPPDRCIAGTQPIDPRTVFYPFGEKPRTGDALYLGSQATFARRGAKVTVTVTPGQAQPVDPSPKKIVWEVLCRTGWEPPVDEPAEGETKAQFSGDGEAAAVTLTMPNDIAADSVGGVPGLWMRARIAAGNYGEEARYTRTTINKTPGNVMEPATFAPPQITWLRLSWTITATRPRACLVYNDFRYFRYIDCVESDGTFKPFTRTAATEQGGTGDNMPALYLGFDQVSSNQPLTLYIAPAPDSTRPPRLVWEYACNEQSGWKSLEVKDETGGLSQRGLVKLITPADWEPRRDFDQQEQYFWLRIRPAAESAPGVKLSRIITNTTWARQSRTVRNELLGSSTGQPKQSFHTTAQPVLEGQELDVREPEPPAEIARANAASSEETRDRSGQPRASWVRWRAVQDFHASGAHDRHYVIDHLTGEVRFGDGQHGMVPPLGRDNIRMTCYSTGGGRRGNRVAGAIGQLKTAVPYVDSVTNHEPAAGGADAETIERVKERGPTFLRHRDRAVTAEDFADLAYAASPEVARAHVVAAPGDAGGRVCLVIVPFGDNSQPSPSLELIRRVEDYIRQRCAPAVTLEVVGPAWEMVSVEATVVLRPEHYHLAGTLAATIAEELERFLHPLSGGSDRRGWPFGRRPHNSDLYRLLTSVEGVDHVTQLTQLHTSAPAASAANHEQQQALVCSGAHKIKLELGRDEA